MQRNNAMLQAAYDKALAAQQQKSIKPAAKSTTAAKPAAAKPAGVAAQLPSVIKTALTSISQSLPNNNSYKYGPDMQKSTVVDGGGNPVGSVNGKNAYAIDAHGQPTQEQTGLYKTDLSFDKNYNGWVDTKAYDNVMGMLKDANPGYYTEMQSALSAGDKGKMQNLLNTANGFHAASGMTLPDGSADWSRLAADAGTTTLMNGKGVLATGGTAATLGHNPYATPSKPPSSAAGSLPTASLPHVPGSQTENLSKPQMPDAQLPQTDNPATDSPATYNPVDQTEYTKNILSLNDALAMARDAVTPQFQRQYEQSAAQAAQNLGASGLYDSVYGQALMAQAQRDIDRDLESAVQQLALHLQGSSREEAMALLQAAINENQFGANFNQGSKLEDRYYTERQYDRELGQYDRQLGQYNADRAYNERMLDRMIAQSNSNRDYAMQMQAQNLKERANSFYEKQANWQMGGFDSEYQLKEAMARLDNELAASLKMTPNGGTLGSKSSSGSSSGIRFDNINTAPAAQAPQGSRGLGAAIGAQAGVGAEQIMAEAQRIVAPIQGKSIQVFEQLAHIQNSTNNGEVAGKAIEMLGIQPKQVEEFIYQSRRAGQ